HPRRRASRAELEHDPQQARKLPQGFRRIRSRARRALRPPQNRATAARSWHRPQQTQNRRGRRQRESLPECAKRIRQFRRLHLAVRRWPAASELAQIYEASSRANPRIRCDEQRSQSSWLQIRRINHLLRLHAGRGTGERPRSRLLPPQTKAHVAANAFVRPRAKTSFRFITKRWNSRGRAALQRRVKSHNRSGLQPLRDGSRKTRQRRTKTFAVI